MNSLLKNKVFLRVMLSNILQNMGIWIRNIALLFFIMEHTNHNPVMVSMLTVIEYAPIFLFSFIGGALADRWNPKKTMVWGDFLSAASVAVILLLVWMGYWQAVFLATFVSAIVSQFSQPCSSKIFKRFVPEEQVGTAIGLVQSLFSLFFIVGPVIGTFIYVQLGIFPSLICLIVIFILSGCVLIGLPETEKEDEEPSNFTEEIKKGFSYVKGNSNLVAICLMFMVIGLSGGLIQPLDVFIVTERLGLDKEHLQWFSALAGVGMLIGGIVVSSLAGRLNVRTTLMAVFLFDASAIVIEALSTTVWITAPLRFLTGFFLAFTQVMLSMFMITNVEEKYIGRVNGLISPIMTGFLLIGTLFSGPFMASFSLVLVFTISAIILLLALFPLSRLKVNLGKKAAQSNQAKA
ncbi:MFS transporter [Paenibacillus larvae]|uniref:Major facilitator superfamily MFS_1 protein n=1 Tax=Paenibacillus larvae subsp. larvae DSM 25430 TaxID=697284 RepID=V9W5P9_9BACL|nr:MFS transporter [Paenibacillus larvae]AHD04457.1 major facilitator superfamily MFS_1 protein [Paenibacillus larvae subsp. larvae DSM 25430]AVG11060.1 major facilitator superfamily MFS_1 protein [Paenibacillus larvae subsp. larvae DSM 25430]MDR5567172.1 MFS transporter [Paenibacillus larvae]MDR5594825.1 MFS transporter [Paenibacillus larvae]